MWDSCLQNYSITAVVYKEKMLIVLQTLKYDYFKNVALTYIVISRRISVQSYFKAFAP